VPAEDHVRLNLELRRTKPEQRVHCQALVSRPVVARCAERLGADEQALLVPPERDFVRADRDEDERRNRRARQDDVLHVQPPCDLGAVAVVTIDQLNDARDILECVHARVVDRIEEPRAALRHERVRRALHELVLDPFLYSFHDSTQWS